METWERMLLQNLAIMVTNQDLHNSIQTRIIIASDGSVQGTQASFAWIIATEYGQRRARCKGLAYGWKPSSYRAEGYGILSAIQFLRLMQHRLTSSILCDIICDNESMIKQMHSTQWTQQLNPNDTMVQDWDILQAIGTTAIEAGTSITINYQHIRGHADDHKPYHRLSLKQQLNVDADKLADQYLQDNPFVNTKTVPHESSTMPYQWRNHNTSA
jgi:hypothetical protein